MSSTNFYPLRVSTIRQETPQAVSITFHVPEELSETFSYQHGQYLTLRAQINGQEVRRAYSMCSSPLMDEGLTVTVKRVKGGRMSPWLCEQLAEGNTIDVMPPEGRFTTPIDADQRKRYYMIGAGSGITPLFSMIKTILEGEPKSEIYLLYGNRDTSSIIFYDQLRALEQRYAGQLFVQYILSQPEREKAKGLSGLFSKGKVVWTGLIGRIDAVVLHRFLAAYPTEDIAAEYFLCGPGSLIDLASATLEGEGIDPDHIHSERFTTQANAPAKADSVQRADGAMATITLDGQTVQLPIPAEKNILDAMLDAGYEPPYSCRAGACSTCMAKVQSGSARMDICYALDDDEVEEGWVLTCQCYVTSDEITLTFGD